MEKIEFIAAYLHNKHYMPSRLEEGSPAKVWGRRGGGRLYLPGPPTTNPYCLLNRL